MSTRQTLLRVSVIVILVLGAVFGSTSWRSARNLRWIAAVRSLNGKIEFEHNREAKAKNIIYMPPPGGWFLQRVFGLEAFATPRGIYWLSGLTDVDGALRLAAQCSSIDTLAFEVPGDASWNPKLLDEIRGLVEIAVLDPNVSDVTWKHVAKIEGLKRIRMAGSCLSHVRTSCPQSAGSINLLSLQGLRLTSEDLQWLAECPELESLSLEDNDLDDSILEVISRISTLKFVSLSRNHLSEKGKEQLRDIMNRE